MIRRATQHAVACDRTSPWPRSAEATCRGALTVTLGADDDSGMTSLAGVDPCGDIPRRVAELRDLGGGHPLAPLQAPEGSTSIGTHS
jgi:hypothetical protein